ncbi:MAG: hypothetical protein ACK5AC_04185 [Planctomycetota bacterium]|jgi:hypothetical protein
MMLRLRILLAFLVLFPVHSNIPLSADEPLWLELPGNPAADMPGRGKRVVLISGDEEYRSEEALPMLAKILSEQHGFHCTVLFSINPETKTIDPNYSSNIPGLQSLDQADFMVMFLRFRALPDEQMQHIDRFVKAGKPFLAIRTSTHPFNFGGDAKTSYADWSWNNGKWPGGFGQQIIGETWISHHGAHNGQATRGVINPKHADSPILNSVTDVFGPTDVYGVIHLPESAQVLMYGQVLSGMKPDDPPLPGEKNEPMMPLIWAKSYQMPGGKEGKVVGSTIGAAVDLLSEDLRRLFINSVYWGVGLPVPVKASVAIPAEYQPSYFGFKPKDYFTQQKRTPKEMLK